MQIYQRIMAICHLREVTAADLARISGVSESAISRFKNQSREPNIQTVRQLAGALQVTLDYLVGEKGNAKPTSRTLAAESLELFCRKKTIASGDRRQLEDLIDEPSAPTTIQEWNNFWDNMKILERRSESSVRYQQ